MNREIPDMPKLTVDDAGKLATLRAELQAARDEMKAGRWVDAADMFAEFEVEDA